MARLCERCQYYTHGNDELTCPECRIPLRFTLLAPQPTEGDEVAAVPATTVAVVAPPPLLPTRQMLARSSVRIAADSVAGWCARHRTIVLAVVVLLALGIGLGSYAGVSGVPLDKRYAQIEVGMDEEDVIDVLESGNPISCFVATFIEIPKKADDSYTWVWEEGRAKITLEITDAKVVAKSAEGLPE